MIIFKWCYLKAVVKFTMSHGVIYMYVCICFPFSIFCQYPKYTVQSKRVVFQRQEMVKVHSEK